MENDGNNSHGHSSGGHREHAQRNIDDHTREGVHHHGGENHHHHHGEETHHHGEETHHHHEQRKTTPPGEDDSVVQIYMAQQDESQGAPATPTEIQDVHEESTSTSTPKAKLKTEETAHTRPLTAPPHLRTVPNEKDAHVTHSEHDQAHPRKNSASTPRRVSVSILSIGASNPSYANVRASSRTFAKPSSVRDGHQHPENSMKDEEVNASSPPPGSEQKSIVDMSTVDENKYYRLVVKVPRVTKSYYNELKDGKPKEKTHSESEMHKRKKAQAKHRRTRTGEDETCVPRPQTQEGSRPTTKPKPVKVIPTKAKINLLSKPTSYSSYSVKPARSKSKTHSQTPKPKKKKKQEEGVISYFDPIMVETEYKDLLENSRNIVVGKPREVLEEYFGYSKTDPLPEALQLDDLPKAFILPKHLWRGYDYEPDTKKPESESQQSRFSLTAFGDDAVKTVTSSPSLAKAGRRKKGAKEILGSISGASGKRRKTKNPLDFFKRHRQITDQDATSQQRRDSEAHLHDPKNYEKVRTKCERKRRRESTGEERDRESEYEIICGSGSSSDSSLPKNRGQRYIGDSSHSNFPTSRESSPSESKRDSAESPKPTTTAAPHHPHRRPHDHTKFVDRNPSDITIDLGPDPMTRLPRDSDSPEAQYYRNFPDYPTWSKENFYDWYKDLQNLDDPSSPRKKSTDAAGDLADDRKSVRYCDEPKTKGRGLLDRSPSPPRRKPSREDYDTKDYLYDNARSTMIMPPTKAVPRYVDDRFGTTHLLEPSGLLHKYVHRDDFGKIPCYLMYRNRELGRPPVPDIDKFYRFHKCKFTHGHIHCPCCDQIFPYGSHWKGDGDGEFQCDWDQCDKAFKKGCREFTGDDQMSNPYEREKMSENSSFELHDYPYYNTDNGSDNDRMSYPGSSNNDKMSYPGSYNDKMSDPGSHHDKISHPGSHNDKTSYPGTSNNDQGGSRKSQRRSSLRSKKSNGSNSSRGGGGGITYEGDLNDPAVQYIVNKMSRLIMDYDRRNSDNPYSNCVAGQGGQNYYVVLGHPSSSNNNDNYSVGYCTSVHTSDDTESTGSYSFIPVYNNNNNNKKNSKSHMYV